MSSNSQTKTTHTRIVILTVLLILAFFALAGRLFYLQVVQAKQYKVLAEDQYTQVKKLTPARGEIKITDKFSPTPYTVASSIEKDLVYADPQSIIDLHHTAEVLSPILDIDIAILEEKMGDKTKKYVPLKKNLTDAESKKVKEAKLSGIAFDPQTTRFYPEKELLSSVLGFVGFDGDQKKGLYGLERYFEKQLAGVPGNLAQEKDAGGAWIFGAKRDFTPAINGDNLLLTIDKSIQFKVENVLKKAVEDNQADSGSVVVLNPKTGAITAMASYPSFDPNEYSKAKNPTDYNNLNTTGNYEPGSVFKAFTMAAAIDEDKVSPTTTYTDTGSVEIDGYTIKNSDNKAHGVQTMTEVLAESLNTGVIFAKEQIGNSEFLKYIKRFGFGKETGVELPETVGNLGNLTGNNSNIKVNYDTASFGQGLSVTPIQLAQAYGALANGGKMMKPYIVQSRITPDGKAIDSKPESLGQVVTSKTASLVSAMLVNVVENGHGKKAKVAGYYVAGKTGTAQVPKKDGKGYEPNNNIGSFAGYAPVDDPRFVMVVRINHPRTVQFAESTAAPAFGQIAQYILNYYDVQPTRK